MFGQIMRDNLIRQKTEMSTGTCLALPLKRQLMMREMKAMTMAWPMEPEVGMAMGLLAKKGRGEHGQG